jgi:phospholipase/carboxylesterase
VADNSLALDLTHKSPEPRDEPSPTGHVWLEHGSSRAVLLTPSELETDKPYPLITVLHGAGRQDEMLVKAVRDEPDRRRAFFLVPRSVLPTWDLIASAERPDLDFLEYAYDLIYRRYPIDRERQALLGYSDGASYALSMGLSNPQIFRAIMAWAAGFIALEPGFDPDAARKPDLLLEYGTHDPIFPFEHVALPMRANLERAGYSVEWRVDQGGKHWPSPDFLPEALDWFFRLT